MRCANWKPRMVIVSVIVDGNPALLQSPRAFSKLLARHTIFHISRDGGTGRRSGLKIRRGSPLVGVQLPLPAPTTPQDDAIDRIVAGEPHSLRVGYSLANLGRRAAVSGPGARWRNPDPCSPKTARVPLRNRSFRGQNMK